MTFRGRRLLSRRGAWAADFFGEVKDGARVTLTFHFWSGATVKYFVTKSGNWVTGTTS